MPRLSDTIVAVSTPAGAAPRGIVRLSGPESVSIARRMAQPTSQEWGKGQARGASSPGKRASPDFGKTYRAFYAELRAEGLAVPARLYVMLAPASYTREDIVEAHVPGAPVILQAVFDAMAALGARPAEPGEFTRRAFLNGRIDLAQAEAVQRVIHAQSERDLRAGVFALRGAVSMLASELRERVADLCAEVEADLDFSDQDIEIIASDAVARRARELADAAGRAAKREGGAVPSSAPRVALRGPVNAGKSTLFNALLADHRAIVSPHPGATRDTIEAEEIWDGTPVWLVDTAGLRPPADEVEAEAISRSHSAGAAADLVVFVLDATQPPDQETLGALEEIPQERRILVLNKADLLPSDSIAPPTPPGPQVIAKRPESAAHTTALHVSAERDPDSVAALRSRILERLQTQTDLSETGIALNARHAAALRRAEASLRRAADAADLPDLAAADLRDALTALGEITGQTVGEDVLDRIFRGFCIGK